ncbi:MAG TPA: hypothetical protein VLM05_17125 [Mycobacteriales bacterium]|nr:hypothetical protein [Mycobacteriales bacterium]
MKPDRTVHLVIVALAAVGLGLSVVSGWGSPPWWALGAFVAAVAITEWVAVRVRIVVGRQGVTFALNDLVMAIAFVLVAPGAWVAVGMGVGFALGRGRIKNRSLVKLAFNVTQIFCSAAVAVVVAHLLGGGVLAACIGLGTYAVLNHLLVAVPISVTSSVPYFRVLNRMGPMAIMNTVGNLSVGVLAGWLWKEQPIGLLGLVVPIGLLWWSYQQQSRRASEAQLFAELAQGQQRLGGSVDASAQVITIAAARLFGAARVEMLLRHPDGLLRYVGDEGGVAARIRVDADALDGPWALRALAARGVLIGEDGDQPYCSAVLGDPERPLAVLIAHRPPRSAPFGRADAQLASVLVGQAESWLSVAELSARRDEAVGRAEAYGAANRVLGDISQETVPALAVLRESAHRLSRLATRFEGPEAVDEIVAELYSVERAVASLLGAIALASDAEVGVALTAGPAPATRTEAEWTTTGRLEDAVGP